MQEDLAQNPHRLGCDTSQPSLWRGKAWGPLVLWFTMIVPRQFVPPIYYVQLRVGKVYSWVTHNHTVEIELWTHREHKAFCHFHMLNPQKGWGSSSAASTPEKSSALFFWRLLGKKLTFSLTKCEYSTFVLRSGSKHFYSVLFSSVFLVWHRLFKMKRSLGLMMD